MQILEYSEIPTAVADAEYDNGKLKYGAGNICNHYLSVKFVEDILPKLRKIYHVARKRIPYFDSESNDTIKPDTNNGYKFELFIFDVFPLADRWTVLEVERQDEFAPIKNAPGSASDAPEHALNLMNHQWKRWLNAVNATVVNGSNDGKVDSIVEISPLRSYAGENLEKLETKRFLVGLLLLRCMYFRYYEILKILSE